MAKYIELIDKYKVVHSDDEDMPTSYTWVDNTGEIVRCGECVYWRNNRCDSTDSGVIGIVNPLWYCAEGVRRAEQ